MTKQGVEHVLLGSPSLPVNCTMQLCQSGLEDIALLTVLRPCLIAGRPNAVAGIHFQYALVTEYGFTCTHFSHEQLIVPF